ncbi:MAG: hypothetical protein ACE5IY_18760 [bacterium]
MKHRHHRHVFRTTVWLLSLGMFLACAGQKPQPVTTDLSAALNQHSADSLAATPAESSSQVSRKPPSKEDQYLTIKFRQNDTEVEMVVDPHSTNLALDLVRGQNGYLEVMKGDSVFYRRGERTDTPQPGSKLASYEQPPNSGHLEHDLTDEIIRDINRAQQMFYERRYEEALNVLKASLAKKRTATAYALGGSIYYVSGELDQAVHAWENALRINPELDQVRELVRRYKK